MMNEQEIRDLLKDAENELDDLHGSYRYVDMHTYMEGFSDALKVILGLKKIRNDRK